MLQLINLNKTLKNKNGKEFTLSNININFADTGLVFIQGPSGSGKSTLLNLISGIDIPTNGQIIYNEKSIYDNQKNISIIFQDFNLFENLTVLDNINIYNDIDSNDIDLILKKLDIWEIRNKKVSQLSGGQKQRVAIARALIKKANIIICDEPTEFLDYENAYIVMDILKEFSHNCLVLVASHNQELAKKYALRTITLENGSLVQDEIKHTSQNKTVPIEKINEIKQNFLFKIATTINFNNKKSFLISIILFIFCLTFIFFTFNIANFDFTQIQVDTLQKENSNILYLSDANNVNIQKYTDNIRQRYCLNNLNISLNNCLHPNIPNYQDFVFSGYHYYHLPFIFDYYENNLAFSNFELIGSTPENQNEIAIFQILAEQIMYYGIQSPEGIIFKPNNIEELVNKEILMGDIPFKITGIYKQDLTKYEYLKKEIYSIGNEVTKDKAYFSKNLFSSKALSFNSIIIVSKNFDKYIASYNYVSSYPNSLGLYFTTDAQRQYEIINEYDKDFNFIDIFMQNTDKILPITNVTTYSFSISYALYYPYLIGSIMKLFVPFFIIIISLILIIYYNNLINKNSKIFAILKSIGCSEKNIKQIIIYSLIFYALSSLIISIIIVAILNYILNLYFTNMVGFYLKPFKIKILYFGLIFLILAIIIVICFFVLNKKKYYLKLKNYQNS